MGPKNGPTLLSIYQAGKIKIKKKSTKQIKNPKKTLFLLFYLKILLH